MTAPLQLVLFGTFFVALNALNDPTSPLAQLASYLPPTAPLVMPPRLAGGDADLMAGAGALVIVLTATAVLVPLAGRLYTGAVLRTGARVRIQEAWADKVRSGSSGRSRSD